MRFKFSLQPIINILYIFLGIILPPCSCCTGFVNESLPVKLNFQEMRITFREKFVKVLVQ